MTELFGMWMGRNTFYGALSSNHPDCVVCSVDLLLFFIYLFHIHFLLFAFFLLLYEFMCTKTHQNNYVWMQRNNVH